MKRMIYADNAATTRMSQSALDVMVRCLAEDYGNASQPYSFAREPKKMLKEARCIIADCIGADPDEIYFTSGGSESDNWAVKNAWLHSCNLVTSAIEHHAILNTFHFVESRKASTKYIPALKNGYIDIDEAKKRVDGDSFLSIMMANNEIGTIEPISQYSLITRNCGAVFHTDAVQAVGHINVNVKELRVDMLSASGHKFNGPKGVGFLYVKNGVELCPLINGGSQESNRRAGTENVAAIVAMATALRENVDNMEVNQTHLFKLEEIVLDMLNDAEVEFVRNGINQLPGLLSLSFEGYDGEAILHRLDLSGICVSTGSACDSKSTTISHVLKAINLDEKLAKGTIRISFGKYNTEDEAKIVADSLIKIVKT